MPFEITFQMDRKAHFSAGLAVLYKPWKHVLILVGVLWAAFFVLFGIDYAQNGAEKSTAAMWQMMSSLLFLSVIFSGVAAFYFAFAPLQAYLSAGAKCRRVGDSAQMSVRFEAKRIVGADGTGHEWTDVKVWRRTAKFWILRDKTKKGQIVVPRSGFDGDAAHGISDERIEEALAYREERICIKNPVAAERARQAALKKGGTAAKLPAGLSEEAHEEKEALQNDDLSSDNR